MRTAAIYLRGKVFIGKSHLEAFSKLTEDEKNDYMVSGFYETETGEFLSDMQKDHFYNKKILLIRHGDSEISSNDPALTLQGIQETIKTTEYLSHIDLSNFKGLTSPLLRCLQTAQIIQKNTKIKFEVEENIMETPSFLQKNESFDLKNHHKEFPEFIWSKKNNWNVKSETNSQFLQRIIQVLHKLSPQTILVTHFGVVTNMAKIALNDEKITKAKVPTASVTFIDNHDVKCFGCTN